MAIWDFRPKGDLWTGVAVGAGMLAAPVVIPLAWSATRPVLKAILKGGFTLYETGRQIFGDATEEPVRWHARAIDSIDSKEVPLARRMKKGEEQEEELMGKPKALERRAKLGRAKPRRTDKRQSKKAEKDK